VHQSRFWKSEQTGKALIDVLVFLTGDNWSFEFRPRARQVGFLTKQKTLNLETSQPIVLPSSHGLDSFVHSMLLRSERPKNEIVRVLTKNPSFGEAPDLGAILELQVPIHVRTTGGESTYRSRSFLFYAVAGTASAMVKGSTVSIPENGQGSLGPSLVIDGNEWPYRGSHPGFTKLLGTLLSLVFDRSLSFEHPRIWNTKGEMLNALRRLGSEKGWEQTRSCPRDQRDLRYSGSRIQCGICGGCLLRRMALNAAGLQGQEQYYWDDLGKPDADSSLILGSRRKTRKNDMDIFLSNALAMNRLSEMASTAGTNARVRQVGYEIAVATGDDLKSTLERLHGLIEKHSHEWTSFVGQLPRESWVRRTCFI